MRKGKAVVLTAVPLLISMAIILSALYLNRVPKFNSPKLIQNGAYILILLNTLIFIKISKKTLREVGVFQHHFLRQIIVGFVIGVIFLAVAGIFVGWGGFSGKDFMYLAFSQVLVAFTEELLFRGYILAILEDVTDKPDRAVFISALLFGLWHYPAAQNVMLVFIMILTGAVYGTLRIVFERMEDEIGILSLTTAHWIFNVFS